MNNFPGANYLKSNFSGGDSEQYFGGNLPAGEQYPGGNLPGGTLLWGNFPEFFSLNE